MMSAAKIIVVIMLALASAPYPQYGIAETSKIHDHSDSKLQSVSEHKPIRALGGCDLSLFLAGDTIITQPWSHVTDPSFQRLVSEIRTNDVALVNLEMLIHEFLGFPQAEVGGTYMRARPEIATELAWAGIDMVAHANNHTFDYGSIGVLENLEHVTTAGLVLAGSGKDLQQAQAPHYFPKGKKSVGLVAAASSFASFGRASRSRPDLHGRPGLNPLAIRSDTFIQITKGTTHILGQISKFLGYKGARFTQDEFDLFGIPLKIGHEHRYVSGQRMNTKDLEANLDSIREAKRNAQIVVFSLHAHHKMQDWLSHFAHQAIEAGADVIFIHGPHRIHGIEVYKDRLIFYGMGDFVFQSELIDRLPAEFYEQFGLGDTATPQDLLRAGGDWGYPEEQEA